MEFLEEVCAIRIVLAAPLLESPRDLPVVKKSQIGKSALCLRQNDCPCEDIFEIRRLFMRAVL